MVFTVRVFWLTWVWRKGHCGFWLQVRFELLRIWALSMCILHFEDSLLDYSAVVSVEFRGWVTLFPVFISFFLSFFCFVRTLESQGIKIVLADDGV